MGKSGSHLSDFFYITFFTLHINMYTFFIYIFLHFLHIYIFVSACFNYGDTPNVNKGDKKDNNLNIMDVGRKYYLHIITSCKSVLVTFPHRWIIYCFSALTGLGSIDLSEIRNDIAYWGNIHKIRHTNFTMTILSINVLCYKLQIDFF